MTWSDKRILDLFGIELPILQAPMANSTGVEMAIAVAAAGGLGALPCAALTPTEIEAGVATFRDQAKAPLNLNFFCHEEPPADPEKDRAWLAHLAPYFTALDVEPLLLPLPGGHPPFGEESCAVVEALRPEIVSFHFGLPPSRSGHRPFKLVRRTSSVPKRGRMPRTARRLPTRIARPPSPTC